MATITHSVSSPAPVIAVIPNTAHWTTFSCFHRFIAFAGVVMNVGGIPNMG